MQRSRATRRPSSLAWSRAGAISGSLWNGAESHAAALDRALTWSSELRRLLSAARQGLFGARVQPSDGHLDAAHDARATRRAARQLGHRHELLGFDLSRDVAAADPWLALRARIAGWRNALGQRVPGTTTLHHRAPSRRLDAERSLMQPRTASGGPEDLPRSFEHSAYQAWLQRVLVRKASPPRVRWRASTAPPRCQRLTYHREHVLEPALRNSERASREFSKAWNRIPRNVATLQLSAAWCDPRVAQARATLRAHAEEPGVVDELRVAATAADAVKHLDPSIREAVRLGLHLFTYNLDLSSELATVGIRHRRHTQHRAFLVGAEYEEGVASVTHRQDRNILHGAPGMDVRGDAELPHYLLMRCVSEMKQGQGRSSLGTALTGCYSTLLHSAEGKKVQTRLPERSLGALYLDALRSSVGEDHEILICTSVGQEGIDLHRHCRHVIHYDLAWNPAVLEQRTGRADRIGSMTFRERKSAGTQGGSVSRGGRPLPGRDL